MVEIKETSYKDERLGFFADQRKLVQKRYDRLEKQIKPDEPYTSERREFLSDLGRELSFYNDVIEMLENDVVPKSEVERLTVESDAMRGAANSYKMHYENAIQEIERLKNYNTGVAFKHYFDGRKEAVEEIFEDIEKVLSDNFHADCQMGDCIEDYYDDNLRDDIAELKKKILNRIM